MNAIGGFQNGACEDCTSSKLSFVENRDTLRIRRSFTGRTINCREQTWWFSKVRLWGLYLIELICAENRDTLRIRKSFTRRTTNCREQTRWFSRVRLWELYLLNWSLWKIVTNSVLGGHLLRARVTVENKLGDFQECACEDFTLLSWSFAENRDILRIRRSFSTRTSNFHERLGGFQECTCEDCTWLNWSFVENRDTLRIRRSFTTRTSNCREKLSGFQKCACEDFTSLSWLWYLVEK